MSTKKKAKNSTILTSFGELALLAPTKIRALEDKVIASGQDFIAGVKNVTMQWTMHAEKHGDYTPLQTWFQRLHDETEGFVVAALWKWVRDNTPLEVSIENGQISMKALKEGEKGYRPYSGEKMAEQADEILKTEEVNRRTRTVIEPLHLGSILKRIENMRNQVKRIADGDSDRKFVGYPDVALNHLNRILALGVEPVKVGNRQHAYNPQADKVDLEKITKEQEIEAKAAESKAARKAKAA